MPPQLSENVVLKIGATDKETELVLDYMSDPIHLPNNKKAYLGVMQVSLMPGWRTRQGYIAEVQASFAYAMSKQKCLDRIGADPSLKHVKQKELLDFTSSRTGMAKKLGLPANRVPTIVSAFPFAEAQILDLTSSYQRQLSFLAQLSGSFPQVPGLQAALKTSFQKLTQQNVGTRNALPLVVPGSQGSDVTYRFDPELMALVDPASTSSGPGHLLEPSSFPALIVMICEEDDLLLWDSLCVGVETRWIPISHRHWFKKGAFDWWYYDSPREKPYSDVERLRNAYDFDSILQEMAPLVGKNPDEQLPGKQNSYTYQELMRRFDNLKTAAMGHTLYTALPESRAQILAVYPPACRRDMIPNQISISGHFFNDAYINSAYVGLQGMPLQINSYSNRLIVADIAPEEKAQLAPGSYDIELVTPAGKTTWPNAITVQPTPPPVISSVIARPIGEYPIALSPARMQETMQIVGTNFVVGDDSLKVVIGGAVSLPPPAPAQIRNDAITYNFDPDDLNLKPGAYDVTVITSGGQYTQSNSLQIFYRTSVNDVQNPPVVPPLVTSIYPDRVRLDQTIQSLTVFGNFVDHNVHFTLGTQGLIPLPTGWSPDGHSVNLPLNNFPLRATNYDLEVVNRVGRTVISNALQVLPVPAPTITNILPMPLQLQLAATPPNANAKPGNQKAPPAAAPAAPPPPPQPDYHPLAIVGENFEVADNSLRILIGGAPQINRVYDDKAAKDIDQRTFTYSFKSDKLLVLNVSTNLASALKKAGNYDLTILTSGGRAVLSNAVSIGSVAPSNQFTITAIYPAHGSLYSTNTFGLMATNISPDGKGWNSWGVTVKDVIVGGMKCINIQAVSSNTLVFTMPPWSRMVSSNDTVMATNKLDVVVVTTRGAAILTNALTLDLGLPIDAQHPYAMTPDEQKIARFLDGMFYEARVMGTNIVVKPQVNLSTSIGAQNDPSSTHASVILPGVSATIQVGGTNAIGPTTGSTNTPPPATKTNVSNASP